MKNVIKLSALGLAAAVSLVSCNDDKKSVNETVTLKAHSKTPNFLKLESDFSNLNVYPLLSSEDKLENTPDFVYGSMADGAGLLKNTDGTFKLINNIEADYSIARITFDKTFKPVGGEYILNAKATANTAQCSGSLVTPEEHGFGPLYLSGGEWGGSSKGVFATSVNKSADAADVAQMLPALGQWSVENAVVLNKNAYPGKTVAFIGDDKGANDIPRGDLGMYVGNVGDLNGGKLYGMKVTDSSVEFESDIKAGKNYTVKFVELLERNVDKLEKECREKGIIGLTRVEDIDWRRGSAASNREVYFCVTGRKKDDLKGNSVYGRIYKLVLNATNPTANATLTCVLDGDDLEGKAKEFLSPDNIVVTENYAYIQEDPNYKNDANPLKNHFASLYQYNLNTGELKKVLECDQTTAAAQGYGTTSSYWEITGMIDVSDVIGIDGSFMVITQNHGWYKEGLGFTDPKANPNASIKENGWTGELEGSVLYLIQGLDR